MKYINTTVEKERREIGAINIRESDKWGGCKVHSFRGLESTIFCVPTKEVYREFSLIAEVS